MNRLLNPAMKNPWTVIICAATIVTLAMGVRQSFGLFMPQMSMELDIGRSSFGLAIAIQNLVFGIAQPFVGALADRHGAGRVTMAGALLYAAGLIAAAMAGGPIGLHLSFGVMVGMALSACTFVVVLGAVGRVVPEDKRSLAFGIVTAGGSLGQFLVVPGAQFLLGSYGYHTALLVMAGIVGVIVILALGVAGKPVSTNLQGADQSLRHAMREAVGHRGYWLINLGFFVCGFQIAFIATHFPAYLNDKGLGASIGATALALIGLFNIFGSYLCGMSGDYYRKQYVLAALYATRGIAIILFLAAPLTTTSALIFAAVFGFLWLGTVPLTSGLVGQIFGIRYLSTLYGIVFMSHQIGSFFGAWAAGYAYDLSGNYNAAWGVCIGLSVLATLIHFPIRDTPVARLHPA